MKRPAGVTLIALLHFVIGLGCVAVLAGVIFAFFVGDAKGDPVPQGAVLLTSALAFAAAALFLSASVGLWKLKRWSRTLAIVLAALSTMVFLASFFEHMRAWHPHQLRSSPFNLPVEILLIPYCLVLWPIRAAIGYFLTFSDIEFVARYSVGIVGNAWIARYLLSRRMQQVFGVA